MKGRSMAVRAAIVALLMAASFVAGRLAGRKNGDAVVEKHDTVRVEKPSASDSARLRVDTVYYGIAGTGKAPEAVRVVDTLIMVDTVERYVLLPITRKTYRDSTYTAVVSGYSPSLDHIETYNKETVRAVKMQPRFSIGIGGGYYATPKGLLPGIGVTLQYNILNLK